MEDRQLLAHRQRALQRGELAVDRVECGELLGLELGATLTETVRLEHEAAEIVQRELTAAHEEPHAAAQQRPLEKARRAHAAAGRLTPPVDAGLGRSDLR